MGTLLCPFPARHLVSSLPSPPAHLSSLSSFNTEMALLFIFGLSLAIVSLSLSLWAAVSAVWTELPPRKKWPEQRRKSATPAVSVMSS